MLCDGRRNSTDRKFAGACPANNAGCTSGHQNRGFSTDSFPDSSANCCPPEDDPIAGGPQMPNGNESAMKKTRSEAIADFAPIHDDAVAVEYWDE